MLLVAGTVQSAPAGLPFVEDFRSSQSHDDTRSTAHWSTAGATLRNGHWSGSVYSKKINLRTVVPRTLQVTATVVQPLHTSVTWKLTNDGGRHWYPVSPGTHFVFPASGNDLRWRADLISTSAALSPRITGVGIDIAGGTLQASIPGASLQSGGSYQGPKAFVNFSNDVTVTLANTGDRDLHIDGITLDDGEDRSSFSLHFRNGPIRAIAPGASASFDVRFSAHRLGPVTGTLSIVSDDPRRSDWNAHLTGYGVPPALAVYYYAVGSFPQLHENQSFEFGSFPVGRKFYRDIFVHNQSEAAIEISRIGVTNSAGRQNDVVPPRRIGSNEFARFRRAMEFEIVRSGTNTATFEIHTKVPGGRLFSMPVQATGLVPEMDVRIDGHSVFDGHSYSVGEVALGATLTLPVQLLNSGNAWLKVNGITHQSSPGLRVDTDSLPLPVVLRVGASSTASVRLAPQTAGKFTATLILSSNAYDRVTTSDGILLYPDNAYGEAAARARAAGAHVSPFIFAPDVYAETTRAVILNGNSRAPGIRMEIDGRTFEGGTGTYDFGRVRLGATETVTVHIHNDGAGALNIHSVSGQNLYYDASNPGSQSVAAGSSTSLVVGFGPRVVGASTATYSINTNAPEYAAWDLRLRGEGVGPILGVSLSSEGNLNEILRPLDDGAVYELNDAAIGSSVSVNVLIRNHGTEYLEISDISVSGGGFMPDNLRPLSFGRVRPGFFYSGVIRLSFMPLQRGVQTGKLLIRSNALPSPEHTIFLRVRAVGPEIAVRIGDSGFDSGAESYSFGVAHRNTTEAETVYISNAGDRTLSIRSAEVIGEGFSLVGSPGEIAPGATDMWTLYFTPSSSNTAYRGTLVIASNDFHAGDWRLPLAGAIGESELAVSVGGLGFESGSGSYHFGRVRTNTTEIATVTIANTGKAKLGVMSVEAVGNAFSVAENNTRSIKGGSSATWMLHFSPPSGVTTHRGTLVIVSDDTDESRWTLNLEGHGGEPDLDVEIGSPGFSSGARHYSFGRVPGGTTGTAEVRIHNQGNAKLNIQSIALEGSPYLLLAGADVRGIAPGSSATFLVHFISPLREILHQRATLSILSNDMDEAVWQSRLEGDVALPDIDVEVGGTGFIFGDPQITHSFGRVRQGSNNVVTVRVLNRGTMDLHVESIATTGHGYGLIDSNPRKIQPRFFDEWLLRFDPPAIPGTYHGTLLIVSDDPDESNWRMKLDAVSVGPDIAVQVGGIDFESGVGSYGLEETVPAVPVTATVTVTNAGNAHLHVQSIEITGDGYSLLTMETRTIAMGSSGSWTLRFNPGSSVAAYRGMLTIVSDDADEGRWTLPLQGTVIGPEIAVEPDVASYDFGEVRKGTTQTLEVAVHNIGNTNLEVSNIGVAGAGYRLAGGNRRTLAAGSSATWLVHFSPQDLTTTHVGMLSIASNDFDERLRQVRLEGTGLGPEIAVQMNGADYESGAGVYHFGEVLSGTSETVAVTVRNEGNLGLDIESVEVTGAGYSLASRGLRDIAVGSSATWLVYFQPPVLSATYHGALTIANDDSDEGDWMLPLTGVSIGPDIAVRVEGVEFESGVGSYGIEEVVLGTEATATVTVMNVGTTDLHIEAVEVTGAGYHLADAATRTIAAGASVSWALVFKPRESVATYSGMLTIVSDDVDEGRWTLALESRAVGPVMVVAPDIADYDFGGVWEGTTQTLEVTVHNEGSKALEAAAGVTGAGYRLGGGDSRTIAAASSGTWLVHFSPPGKITPDTGTLTITGNDYVMPVRVLSLRGFGIGPEIAVEAGAVNYESGVGVYNFGGVLPGTSETVTVRVRNEGNSDLNIESVSAAGVGYSVVNGGSRVIPMNSSAAWLVRLAAQAYGTTYRGTLTIASDDADEGDWTLSLIGVSGGPEIAIEVTGPGFERGAGIYDFGGVTVSTRVNAVLTVGNHGNAILVLESVSVAGDDYDVSDGARVVNPGSSATYTLYFSPHEAVEISTGVLTIVSDDPHSPEKTLGLTGYGIGPLMTPIMIIGGQFFGYGSSEDYDFIASIGVRERFRISLVLQNLGNAPLEVNDLTVSGTGFKLEADLPGLGLSRRRTIAPGNATIYTNGLIFQSDVRGVHTGLIQVDSNDIINPFPIRLRIDNVEPEIEVEVGGVAYESGGVFDSGRVPVSMVGTAAVVIRNAATRELNIRSISATGVGYSLADTGIRSIAPGSSGTWMLRFAPPDSATTPYRGALTILNDDYDESTWSLSLEGTGIESEIEVMADGNLVESSATLNFGRVIEAMATTETVMSPSGSATPTETVRYRVVSGSVVTLQDGAVKRLSVVHGAATKTVTVRNTGTYVLKVSAALLSGLGYSSDMPSSFEVAPGESTSFNIAVAPTGDRRAFFGKIVLATNDIDEKVWVLNMATFVHGIQVNVKVFLEGPYEYR